MTGSEPRVSIVIGTRNRSALLARALRSLCEPRAEYPFEIVVVGNACTDDTEQVIDRVAAKGWPVVYRAEPRPGVSYARNAGVAAARARFIACMDDDQEAAPGWIAAIVRTFQARPDVHFLAGPVTAVWSGAVPQWLSEDVQGAVSIIDRGVREREIDVDRWMCVPGGNSAYRREVVEAVGGWRPYARSQDRELTVRLLLAGYSGLYVPGMRMWHHLDAARATRAHFRRWHEVEGRMRANYRFEELFDSQGRLRPGIASGRTLGGVPLHLYRRLCRLAVRWAVTAARGRHDEAFRHEVKARYLASYIRARLAGAGATAPDAARGAYAPTSCTAA